MLKRILIVGGMSLSVVAQAEWLVEKRTTYFEDDDTWGAGCFAALGTQNGPWHGPNPLAADSANVGATLVVARPGIVQAAGTGRDKPVPYNARAG